ncbi:TetR/AcrR family transcriptional regulator C-terminal domain-containing protein [Actinomadura rayongensis]|uniref:TetR family transcriptional regulator n=1 Tax=Actinomadura rayongensis TaxID=1429076 RepID=A0A6I4WGI3_9ACTN|nr:TetR family transcriptional regulator [Actinomadura rayongensis]
MTESGDPRRSLALLWGRPVPPRRGPKPRLSVERIVAAAVAVADAAGLDALSMRRVADDLGVSPMTLYTYVPGKAELLDLMWDRAWAGLVPPGPVGWRDALEHLAREHWRLYHRHPWLLAAATSRPRLGPHTLDRYETALAAVDGLGLTDVEMDAVVALVEGFAASAARASVEARAAERRTGRTDLEWWEATAPVLAELVEPDRYPLATRVGTAAGQAHQAASDPEYAFAFGLARVLDGIAALVAARS